MEQNNDITQVEQKLTKKDVRFAYFIWWLIAEVSISFERMQALSFCACLQPILRKLYKKKEDLVEAYQRHLEFFNTEGVWGAIVHGVTIAMEEQRANGENIPDSAIINLKVGLMGPFAGIGDTINYAILKPMIYGAAASIALSGSPMAVPVILTFSVITGAIGYFLFNYGYSMGRSSIAKVLHSGWIDKIILASGIVGMFMMGALASSYVSLTTVLEIPLQSGSIVVQEMIDAIAPGLLSLAAVFGAYWFISKKGMKINVLLVIIIVLCLIGAFFGIV